MKRIMVISFVLLMVCVTLSACGGASKEAKDAVEKQSPGATVISVEKAKSKVAGGDALCITYQPKNGGVARMILTDQIQINNVPEVDFLQIGCEK